MVLASRSQLAPSSGVVAAIWPRICNPVRKSSRLNAASASVRSVAVGLATAPASLLIWASSLMAESARSSRLKALSAACAVARPRESPSTSVAQNAAARTKPIMMDLLGTRTGAAWRINGREKVTDSRREDERAKESHMALPTGPWPGSGGLARRTALWADNGWRSTRSSLSRSPQTRFAMGLGGRADFSYWRCYKSANGPIAQLDRVTDFYSVGCRFESCWDRHSFSVSYDFNGLDSSFWLTGLSDEPISVPEMSLPALAAARFRSAALV